MNPGLWRVQIIPSNGHRVYFGVLTGVSSWPLSGSCSHRVSSWVWWQRRRTRRHYSGSQEVYSDDKRTKPQSLSHPSFLSLTLTLSHPPCLSLTLPLLLVLSLTNLDGRFLMSVFSHTIRGGDMIVIPWVWMTTVNGISTDWTTSSVR